MCKRRTRETTQRQGSFEGETIRRHGPFEGETIRLDRQAAASQQSCGSSWAVHRHMIWWMIWPLIALVKWLAPLALGALETVGGTMVSVPLLVPIVLIAAGLLLLRRR
jgi:hypothetical protein